MTPVYRRRSEFHTPESFPLFWTGRKDNAVRAFVGESWRLVLHSFNQGAVEAPGGEVENDGTGNASEPVASAEKWVGKGIGGILGAVVPNSLRQGSIGGVKAS